MTLPREVKQFPGAEPGPQFSPGRSVPDEKYFIFNILPAILESAPWNTAEAFRWITIPIIGGKSSGTRIFYPIDHNILAFTGKAVPEYFSAAQTPGRPIAS